MNAPSSLITPLGTIYYSKDWGSLNKNHRLTLREFLAKKHSDPSLLDISKKPNDTTLSISHCKLFGGYYSEKYSTVGLDIEEKNRINKDLVQRISTPDEVKLLQEKSHLIWPIKEAAFKAFSNIIKTMTEVRVSNVQDLDQGQISGTVIIKNFSAQFIAGALNPDTAFAIVVHDEE